MKGFYAFFLGLLFCFLHMYGHAQVADTSRLDFVAFTTENDFYYLRLPSDRYYTAGQSLTLRDRHLDQGRYGPAQLLPLRFEQKQAFNLSQLRLRYQLFTPFRIHWERAEALDRPYAARLDLQFENQTFLPDQHLKLHKALLIGFQGPSLRGEKMQNGLHQLKGRPLAQGWQYQLADRGYWAARLQAEKRLLGNKRQLLLASPQLYLGNIQQFAQLGLHYKHGDLDNYFRPGKEMPPIHWHIYLHLSMRYVHSNQLLNGPMRPDEDITVFQAPELQALIYRASYGIDFTWKQWSLRLSQEAISPEFSGGSSHYWGSISLRKYY